MTLKIYNWSEIEHDFNEGIILGNGASIAFDKRFAYKSLKEKAEELNLITDNCQQVFKYLDTNDFELVLRMLWHASKVNDALEVSDDKTRVTYEGVRAALIKAVGEIHAPYQEVRDRLVIAADFMSRFQTVISLNYDVLVYWAILIGNKAAPSKNRFKDCFKDGTFNKEWESYRNPYQKNDKATLIFYPHGNLALATHLDGSEIKIVANSKDDLLNTIFNKWRSGYMTPLFVSEGTSVQKARTIQRSPYLSRVYEEVLANLGKNIAIFGWSMGEQDDHLLKALRSGKPEKIAFAVDPNDDDLKLLSANIESKLKKFFAFGTKTPSLFFFNRESDGCWITPRSAK